MQEVSDGKYRVTSNYFEDPTAQGGAQEDVDRAIYVAGLSAPVTAYSAVVIAARASLGISNTAVDLTYDQDMALSAAMDSIALNLAQALTQPTISALANSTDATEQSVFATLNSLATSGWSPAASAGGGGYSGLNEQEKRVCKKEAYDCYRVRNTPQYSFDWSERYYPHLSPRNTARDAHRHCVWTALMTERANSGFAKRFGDAHEFGASGQPIAERDMDLHNNFWGRDVGVRTEGRRDVTRADGCRDFVSNRTLRWLA